MTTGKTINSNLVSLHLYGFLGGAEVKASASMQETRVQSLGQEDPLEKEMATHFSVLAGKSHRRRSLAGYSPWGHRVRHD